MCLGWKKDPNESSYTSHVLYRFVQDWYGCDSANAVHWINGRCQLWCFLSLYPWCQLLVLCLNRYMQVSLGFLLSLKHDLLITMKCTKNERIEPFSLHCHPSLCFLASEILLKLFCSMNTLQTYLQLQFGCWNLNHNNSLVEVYHSNSLLNFHVQL
jgi:hypothetical protein